MQDWSRPIASTEVSNGRADEIGLAGGEIKKTMDCWQRLRRRGSTGESRTESESKRILLSIIEKVEREYCFFRLGI